MSHVYIATYAFVADIECLNDDHGLELDDLISPNIIGVTHDYNIASTQAMRERVEVEYKLTEEDRSDATGDNVVPFDLHWHYEHHHDTKKFVHDLYDGKNLVARLLIQRQEITS